MLSKLAHIIVIACVVLASSLCHARTTNQKHNDLDALWNVYSYTYINGGRVIARDENNITTSEGQSYAMLRAVWSGDRTTFDTVWQWTQQNLSRPDHLFSWKWKDKILDVNAATDADTDIALALLLAAERFDDEAYKTQALRIINSIWEHEVVQWHNRYYITGGNWAPSEAFPTIHVGYLAPYAYQLFAEVDPAHPWEELIHSSYAILEWIYFEQRLLLPPEKIYLNKKDGSFLLNKPGQKPAAIFSYDVFPIFWRVATDQQWFGRGKTELRQRMLSFFEAEWARHQRFLDRYTLQGEPQSSFEALPLYATVSALARINESAIVSPLEERNLLPLWSNALIDKSTPYYLHNWLWFDRALELKAARTFKEFLAFLYPFDVVTFKQYFPAVQLAAFLVLVLLFRVSPASLKTLFKSAALVLGIYLCARYLWWRYEHSLNFIEPSGPYISIALLAAEIYCFTTVMFLLLQVGVRAPSARKLTVIDTSYQPSVDILIPIYSESLEILEATLMGASMMNYPNKNIYVCDDSHRESVKAMAEQFGGHYIRGPKKHAKAGNINNALQHTSGELILIFDTDHIPVVTFLDETVPLLADEKVGFVQTSHHFYNPDIFQNALRTPASVSDEQDFFHHGIQPGRDNWGGAFFVGTGAVFRRTALEEVGGLLLMSITEDIHTSQHLHAKGWESRYVSQCLAVGLNAENLSSYLVQRTRWMQGCLQVFFKDNPLFTRGLPLRHRLGYFASQYYFFFPIARIIFFLAPLAYLFFHWHPIFADLSILLAYLLPFMICLPILSQLLVPGWPRIIWASVYENTISAALFRGIIDLALPKKLSFKVTPKGIANDTSRFDFQSSKYSLFVLGLTLLGVIKGLAECFYFGIEKDAYFFNLTWAGVNLLLLMTPLVIAREHPRYAYQNRIRKTLPLRLSAPGLNLEGNTYDIDLTGFSLFYGQAADIPRQVEVCIGGDAAMTATAHCTFFDRDESGNARIGFDFDNLNASQRQWILRHVHCDPATWEEKMARRTRSNLVMVFHFFNGLLKSLRRPQEMFRMQPRTSLFRLQKARIGDRMTWVLAVDKSRYGQAVHCIGSALPGQKIQLLNGSQEGSEYVVVYQKTLFPGYHRLGLKTS